MTVFVGPKRALLGSVQSIPSWVAPDAMLAMQFGRDQYWRKRGGILPATSVLAVTRSSPINLPDDAGVFQTLGNNVLPRTDRGLYANGQVTNKCVHYNAAPPALVAMTSLANFNAAGTNITASGGSENTLFGIVDASATIAASPALAQLYSDGILNGRALRINNASGGVGAGLLDNGSYGNLNAHVFSGWWWGSGSGNIRGTHLASTPASVAAPATPTYRETSGTPTNVVGRLALIADAAADLYFLLGNFQEASFASPPIVTAGAPATLFASDIRAIQGTRPSNGQPEPFPGWEAAGFDAAIRALADVRIDRLSANSPRFIAGAGVDTNNLWRLIFDTDNRFKLIVRKSGSDVLTLQSGVASSTGLYTVDTRAKPGDYALSATGLPGATSSSSETLPSGVTTLRVGSNFALANPFNGWIEGLQILRAV